MSEQSTLSVIKIQPSLSKAGLSMCLLMFLSLTTPDIANARSVRTENSLSYGSFQAPAHSRQRSYAKAGNSSKSSQDRSLSAHSEEYAAYDLSNTEGYYEDPNQPMDHGMEGTASWRGYLKEKGPSRMIVEVEVQHEIQPLSKEVWELIMGSNPEIEPQQFHSRKEATRIERTAVTIPKKQLNEPQPVIVPQEEEGPQRIHKEEDDDEDAILKDAAESHRQIMDLFNRPVFATPTAEFGDGEGIASFRLPQGLQPANPALREGSRARFEIRR